MILTGKAHSRQEDRVGWGNWLPVRPGLVRGWAPFGPAGKRRVVGASLRIGNTTRWFCLTPVIQGGQPR